jgi:hypothetical protein
MTAENFGATPSARGASSTVACSLQFGDRVEFGVGVRRILETPHSYKKTNPRRTRDRIDEAR